jgi:putative ABC transport system permease protein
MIEQHVRAALRNLIRFKSHTVISLVGLVIGLASVFVISAWTIQELRFDRFHHQSDRIYMVTTDIKDNTGNVSRFPETPAPLAAALEMQIPQIEKGFHFLYLYGGRSIGTEANAFKEQGIAATPDFLEVFNFRLVSGAAVELHDPNSVFLSRRLADKLFPEGDPLHKELLYKEKHPLVVKGVFRDVPRNSSLQFDFLIPYRIEYGISDKWWQLSDATFIKTASSADIDMIHSDMKKIWRDRISDNQFNIGIIPITDLRYGADFEFFNAAHGHGDRNKLYMFIGVAGLILILACLNYLNLISAQAVKRENEIWIRKVHGASAGNIRYYFIIESVLLSIIAWGCATLLSMLALRVFEQLLGIVIDADYFYKSCGIGLLVAVVMVGLASGFYPAIRAGALVLGQTKQQGKPDFKIQRNTRNGFVLSQFVLSIALLVSSLIILRQANFMKDFDTGYVKQNIAAFYLPIKNVNHFQAIRDRLNANPAIDGYSFGSASPVNLTVLNTMEKWRWEGLGEGVHTSFYVLAVDEEYLNVFEIPLIEGRFFNPLGTDQNRIVINEKLAALTGFENPVGQILRNGEEKFEIIGVVKDFNFQHARSEIRPLLFKYGESPKHLFVKIKSNQEGNLGSIREQISAFTEDPAACTIVSDEYNKLYKGEQQILSTVMIFTILSMLLSSLGLVGSVTYDTETRKKETAVRKVFGAKTSEVMVSLNLDLLKMFLPSVLLGCFIAWLIMREWLKGFVYRKDLEAWIFLIGAFIILLVALLSVSVQTWKAARQSPAVTLRSQ